MIACCMSGLIAFALVGAGWMLQSHDIPLSQFRRRRFADKKKGDGQDAVDTDATRKTKSEIKTIVHGMKKKSLHTRIFLRPPHGSRWLPM